MKRREFAGLVGAGLALFGFGGEAKGESAAVSNYYRRIGNDFYLKKHQWAMFRLDDGRNSDLVVSVHLYKPSEVSLDKYEKHVKEQVAELEKWLIEDGKLKKFSIYRVFRDDVKHGVFYTEHKILGLFLNI